MTTKQRTEWESEIRRDFPDMNEWVLRNMLDLYFSEGGKVLLDNIVKEQIKKDKKSNAPPINKNAAPKERTIDGLVSIRKWDDNDDKRMQEFYDAHFKVITPEQEEIKSTTIVEEKNDE